MRRDELRQPLRKRSTAERLWARKPGALAAAASLSLAGFIAGSVWLVRIPYPHAGEPVIIAVIPPAEELITNTTLPAAEEPEEPVPEDLELAAEPVTEDVAIIVPQRRPLLAAPVAAVMEETPAGPLPRVGPGGKKSSDVYARLTPLGVLNSDRPKIAILLGGMGLNAKLTAKAVKDLPPDITFAFAPYGSDLQNQVNRARAQGHEVLLQLPMEPVGYPARNPGPKTLLADATEDENREALHWHMSRFSGYTGVTNYMGGRFLTTPASLKPMFADIKRRGLVFLEDATIPLSSTAVTAKAAGLASRRAHIVIDADPDPASIASALKQLETEAAANGLAIGTGAGLDVTIEAIAEWSRDLAERGIVLVPVSAVYKGHAG